MSFRTLQAPGKAWMWVVVAAVCLSAAGWWVFVRTGGDSAAAAEATTATVTLAPHRVTVAGPGTLEAGRSANVPSGVGGTVIELVEVGDRVEEGDVVASLDPAPFERAIRDAELALEQAEAKLDSLTANQADAAGDLQQSIASAEQRVATAQREVDRSEDELDLTTRLHDIGSESAAAVRSARDAHESALAELESARIALERLLESRDLQRASDAEDRRSAELAVDQAQLDLEDARDDLAAITTRAPFSGVVSEVFVEVGSSVMAEGRLMQLIDDATITLAAQIDETQIERVDVGQTADVTLDAVANATFTGEVTAISPVAEMENNIPIFYVTIALENASSQMRPGMTAEADIVVEEVADAARVPLEAVQTGRGGFAGASADGEGRPDAGELGEGGPAGGLGGEGFAGGGFSGSPPGGNGDGGGGIQAPFQSGGGPGGFAGGGSSAASERNAERHTVMVLQDDGSYAPVPVTLVDSEGFDAIVQGNLSDGDVVLVPEGSASASNASDGSGNGGPPSGGPGGGFPGGGFGPGSR